MTTDEDKWGTSGERLRLFPEWRCSVSDLGNEVIIETLDDEGAEDRLRRVARRMVDSLEMTIGFHVRTRRPPHLNSFARQMLDDRRVLADGGRIFEVFQRRSETSQDSEHDVVEWSLDLEMSHLFGRPYSRHVPRSGFTARSFDEVQTRGFPIPLPAESTSVGWRENRLPWEAIASAEDFFYISLACESWEGPPSGSFESGATLLLRLAGTKNWKTFEAICAALDANKS